MLDYTKTNLSAQKFWLKQHFGVTGAKLAKEYFIQLLNQKKCFSYTLIVYEKSNFSFHNR